MKVECSFCSARLVRGPGVKQLAKAVRRSHGNGGRPRSESTFDHCRGADHRCASASHYELPTCIFYGLKSLCRFHGRLNLPEKLKFLNLFTFLYCYVVRSGQCAQLRFLFLERYIFFDISDTQLTFVNKKPKCITDNFQFNFSWSCEI